MKLLRANPDQFVFHIGRREQRLLFDTLELYPLVPPAHHRIALPGQMKDDEAQRLLDEALAEQRSEHRAQIRALRDDPERLQKTSHGFQLSLAPAQMEWLLQVLNDVRVGSWLALGEPEEGEVPRLNSQNSAFLVALEVCGIYQSVLLSALGAEPTPE